MNDKNPNGFLILIAIVALVVMIITATMAMIFVSNNPDIFKPDIRPESIKGYNYSQTNRGR